MKLNRKNRIILGSSAFVLALVIDFIIKIDNPYIILICYLISYAILGGDILRKAFRNIGKGQLFDENLLMSIATIGAFFMSEYPEGVAVMLFYQIGEHFQSKAVESSRKSIAGLMDIRPEYANIRRGEKIVTVGPDEVKVGDIIVVKAGEKIPVDAIVLEGQSSVDTSALTGESVHRSVNIGDALLSGTINIGGMVVAQVTKEYEDSLVSKILDLVENAGSKKSKSEQFITRFARYYTPAVVITSLLLAILPPLLISGQNFHDWAYRALSFLVVSCPCALVISIPLSFFSGIGGASKKGILIKGSNYLEALSNAEIIAFDKTGTLTIGVFEVQEMGLRNIDHLELLAIAESISNHPIAKSITKYYGKSIDSSRITDSKEIAGKGIVAVVDGKQILAGNSKLMDEFNIIYQKVSSIGSTIYVAVEKEYAGHIVISDAIKEDSAKTVQTLKKIGIKETVMLTGDNSDIADKVANFLSIDKVFSQLLPTDKVEKFEQLFKSDRLSDKGKIVFVGDGINDAPVLARADIGISMGGLGSDAAIEAADVVIMNDEPSKIVTAINISKKTVAIAKQNTVFAIGVKLFVLVLSAIGYSTMWAAIFADIGVTVIAILNSFRALDIREYEL